MNAMDLLKGVTKNRSDISDLATKDKLTDAFETAIPSPIFSEWTHDESHIGSQYHLDNRYRITVFDSNTLSALRRYTWWKNMLVQMTLGVSPFAPAETISDMVTYQFHAVDTLYDALDKTMSQAIFPEPIEYAQITDSSWGILFSEPHSEQSITGDELSIKHITQIIPQLGILHRSGYAHGYPTRHIAETTIKHNTKLAEPLFMPTKTATHLPVTHGYDIARTGIHATQSIGAIQVIEELYTEYPTVFLIAAYYLSYPVRIESSVPAWQPQQFKKTIENIIPTSEFNYWDLFFKKLITGHTSKQSIYEHTTDFQTLNYSLSEYMKAHIITDDTNPESAPFQNLSQTSDTDKDEITIGDIDK